MKIVISEGQLPILLTENRLDFLKKTYNVSDDESIKQLKDSKTKNPEFDIKILGDNNDKTIAVVAVKKGKPLTPEQKAQGFKSKIKSKVFITNYIFDEIVNADPTTNKEYVQWMLNIFTKHIKDGHYDDAIRFGSEDLPQANEFLTIFNENKDSKLFKEIAKNTPGSPDDPSNILKYTELSQLYKIVKPFIAGGSSSELEKDINTMVSAGNAKILYSDSKWLVYQPLTTKANCVLHKFASWCTSRPENTMFNSYTTNYKSASGKPSKIYNILNKKVLTDESDEMYQIHFETDQYKDKSNGSNIDFIKFLNTNHGLRDFFSKEMLSQVKHMKGNIKGNKYIKILLGIGHADIIFDLFDKDTEEINIDSDLKIHTLPENFGSVFTNLKSLVLIGVGLSKIPNSIGNIKGLEILILKDNDISNIPESLGSLTSMEFLSLTKNPITKLPDNLKNLVNVYQAVVPAELKDRAKELFPNARVVS